MCTAVGGASARETRPVAPSPGTTGASTGVPPSVTGQSAGGSGSITQQLATIEHQLRLVSAGIGQALTGPRQLPAGGSSPQRPPAPVGAAGSGPGSDTQLVAELREGAALPYAERFKILQQHTAAAPQRKVPLFVAFAGTLSPQERAGVDRYLRAAAAAPGSTTPDSPTATRGRFTAVRPAR